MTTANLHNWDALVATHAAAEARSRSSLLAEAAVTDDERAALDDAEDAAWVAVMHAAAPDLQGLAYKLRLLLNFHVKYDGDTPDSMPFLQRLLDDTSARGGFPLVRLLQDCHRLDLHEAPVLSLSRSEDKAWPELVAAFKQAHAFINRPGSDDVSDEEAENFNPIRDAVYYYPVGSLVELSEKLALIEADDGGDARGFAAIAEDIERLAEAAR